MLEETWSKKEQDRSSCWLILFALNIISYSYTRRFAPRAAFDARYAQEGEQGILCLKTSQFRLTHSQFRPPAQKTGDFDPNSKTRSNSISNTKIKLISTRSLKSSQFRCPDTKNQVNFDPDTKPMSFSTPTQKPSQFRSRHRNQIKFDPLHWNQVNFDHPHENEVRFNAHTRNKWFLGGIQKRSFDHPYSNQVHRSPQ